MLNAVMNVAEEEERTESGPASAGCPEISSLLRAESDPLRLQSYYLPDKSFTVLRPTQNISPTLVPVKYYPEIPNSSKLKAPSNIKVGMYVRREKK